MTAADEGQSIQNYMLGEIANLVSMIPALKASTEPGAYDTVLAAMDDMLTQMRPGEDGPVLRITADLADQARAHLAEDRGTAWWSHWRWLDTPDPGA